MVSQSFTSEIVNHKPTVLVVDDEAGPRDALKVILRPFFNIQSAESARATLDVLNSQPVDLITLDQKLPDRQGLDLLQEIKHFHSDVEVIIITGYGSLKSAMEGIRHGAAGYLLKPFNVTELITLVNQTIQKRQRLDYLREFIHSTRTLWGPEAECAQAWKDMQEGYNAIGASGAENQPAGESPDLLPMLSDLLEAKDRQLLNHCSHIRYPGPDGVFGRTDPRKVDASSLNFIGLDPDDPSGRDDVVMTQNQLYRAEGRPVRVRLRSLDVIHSFFLPNFLVKQDAMPGMTSEIWFVAQKPGDYEIACAEHCGLGHYRMRGQVHVVPATEFEAAVEKAIE